VEKEKSRMKETRVKKKGVEGGQEKSEGKQRFQGDDLIKTQKGRDILCGGKENSAKVVKKKTGFHVPLQERPGKHAQGKKKGRKGKKKDLTNVVGETT